MNILVTGAVMGSNSGDFAMLDSFVSMIKHVAPAARITIVRLDTEVGSLRSNVPGEYAVLGIDRSVFRNFQHAGLLWALQHAGLAVSRSLAEYARAARECDVIVDISGDSISDDYPHGVWIPLFFHSFAIRRRKPLVYLAQSIGPFVGRVSREVAKLLLSRAAVTAREPLTLQHLEAFRPRALFLTNDLAFLLQRDESAAARVPALAQSQDRIVGVFLSTLIARFAPQWGGTPEQRNAVLIDLVTQELSKLLLSKRVQLVFLSSVVTDGQDDRELAKAVEKRLSALGHAARVSVVTNALTPRQLKGLVARLDALLTFRMHPSIYAISEGVPTLVVAYSHKVHGLVGQRLGLPDYIVDIRHGSPEAFRQQLADKLQFMLSSTVISDIFAEASVHAIGQAEQNLEVLCSVVPGLCPQRPAPA